MKNALNILGQINPTNQIQTALNRGHINFRVSKLPLVSPINQKEIPNQFGLFREDNGDFLGTCKNRYIIRQNREIFETIKPILADGKTITHAGQLDSGGRVFLAVESASFDINGESFDNYLTIITSHDGSNKLTFGISCVRRKTNAIFFYPLNFMSKILSFKHTEAAGDKLKKIKDFLKTNKISGTILKDIFQKLSESKLEDDKRRKITSVLFPLAGHGATNVQRTRRRNVFREFKSVFSKVNVGKLKDTALSYFLSIIEFNSEFAQVKGANKEQARAASLLTGNLYLNNYQALNLILKEVK